MQHVASLTWTEWILYSILGLALLAVVLLDYTEDNFRLKFEMRTSEEGRLQVYYDIGNNFNFEDSKEWNSGVVDEWETIYFDLPKTQIKNLRLDPIDNLAKIEIRNVELINGIAYSEELFGIKHLYPFRDITDFQLSDGVASFNSTTGDPIMGFDIDYEWLAAEIQTLYDKRNPKTILSLIALVVLLYIPGIALLRDYAVYLGLAVFFYIVFYPGIHSPDSLNQYQQALYENFSNWHPPVMAILLSYWLKAGLELPHVIFAQLILGLLGCRYLIIRALDIFSNRSWSASQVRVASVILSFILLLPLTPNIFYWVTFWKDVWIAIVFVWMCGLILHLLCSDRCNSSYWVRFIALLCLFQASLLLRHNAIVLLPVFLGLVYLLSPLTPRVYKIALMGANLACFMLIGPLIDKAYDVKDLHPRNQVMALELVGILVVRPELKSEIPYTASMLNDNYREDFRWGEYSRLRWYKEPIVKRAYINDSKDKALSDEYFRTAFRYPLTLISVKFRNYFQNLGIVRNYRWHESVIFRNDMGLIENRSFVDSRTYLDGKTNQVYHHPILKWVSSAHFVYLILNLCIVTGLLIRMVSEPTKILWGLFMLWLIPLGFYLSYILATPGIGYRFMFASTISIQCMLLSWISLRILKFIPLKKRTTPKVSA